MKTGNYGQPLNPILISLIFWIMGNNALFAQDYLFDAETINVEDGLPHRLTCDIVQDAAGFIWVSTLFGISRYDGYNFKNYSNISLGIAERSISPHLAVDAQNRIWYAGNLSYPAPYPHSGLIDNKRDSISSIEAVSEGRFTAKDVLYVGNSAVTNDHILIVTRNGMVYEYEGTFTERYRHSSSFSEWGNTFCEALPDGSYWLIVGRDVMRIKDGKKIQHITSDFWIKRISSVYPELILEVGDDSPRKIWKLENNAFIPITLPGQRPEAIQSLLQIHPDYSCYTTGEKLEIRDKQGNLCYDFNRLKLPTDDRYFPNIQNMLTDRQGMVWIATSNGLLKLSMHKNPFKNLGVASPLRGIHREGDRLWIATEGLGDVVKKITSGIQKEFWPHSHDNCSAISFYSDHQGQLWIGSNKNVLVRYLPDTDTYDNLDTDAALQLVFQNTLTQTYWIASDNEKLFRFDPATRKLTPFPLPEEGVYIRQFYQNAEGIWIVSRSGLLLMDAKREVIIKHYTTANGLPFDEINHLYEDSAGMFWLGTKGSGLIRWDRKKNSFCQYTHTNGLSNNNIYAVYEDDYQTLWLPSDYGLMAFDQDPMTWLENPFSAIPGIC